MVVIETSSTPLYNKLAINMSQINLSCEPTDWWTDTEENVHDYSNFSSFTTYELVMGESWQWGIPLHHKSLEKEDLIYTSVRAILISP